jgi:RimJ/RimL family protein N-acetyltransferase
MPDDTNYLGQPIGVVVPDWKSPPYPTRITLSGQYCRVEPLDAKLHAAGLFAANSRDTEGKIWTYFGYGPFTTFDSYLAWIAGTCCGNDPLFFAIIDLKTNEPLGVASYLRIDPANGSIEVGHINYSPQLQRTPIATEAMYLMMKNAFELGYRRYEWKCNACNAASRAAAQRFGFSFEGVFRQATVAKGRNRDTAWYAAIDKEWPALNAAFLKWLDPANFDSLGKQRIRLSNLTESILVKRG